MEPQDLDLHVVTPVEDAANVQKRLMTSLSDEAKARINATLREALQAELTNDQQTLGLNPGEDVAISSSVGQSISF